MPRDLPALLLIATLFISSQLAAEAALSFTDEFNGSSPSSVWSFEHPGPSASVSVSGGRLNLTAGRGNDQWVFEGGTVVNLAPRLLKTQPAGSWTIETRVTGNTGNGLTFAGLTVFKDASNWLLWGQLSNTSLEGSGIINGGFTFPVASMTTEYSYLRVRKAGNTYYFDGSADGFNWTNANSFTDSANRLSGARIGLLAKDWNIGSGASYTINFDYFRQHNADLMPSLIDGASTTQIAQETGADSINNTDDVDVCGTDLGIMFDWLGFTQIVFGDTVAFGDKSTCIGKNVWDRSNTLALTDDVTPSNGLLFDAWITDASGNARELFAEDSGGITAIPTGAIALGSSAYIYYMNVTQWISDGVWSCNHSSIASAGSGNPSSWSKHSGSITWGAGNFSQLAVVPDGSTLYVYGVPCGRFGSIRLMKVASGSILQKSAYQYFSGYDLNDQPTWSSSESNAATVAGGPAGELSVRFNQFLGRWILTYLDERKIGVVIREAPNPWGPWSAPTVMATSNQYPRLYGAFTKDGFETNNGQGIYYMMSRFDTYQAYLMRTTLSTAPQPPIALDSDHDGYNDDREQDLGTDDRVYCSVMRADVDHDEAVSILDIAAVAGVFGQAVPPANLRYDQGPAATKDGVISILDIAAIAGEFGKLVGGCP